MSTLLMSTNLVEPFFSTPTDPKEYLHSFSDSLINFSPPPPGTQEHLSTSINSPMGEALVSGHHQHHHHLGSHHVLGSHSSLSDIFKCVEEDQYDVDFHSQHHTLCSPCLIDDYNIDVESASWSNKSPDQWQAAEVAEWIRDWARQNEIQDIEVAHLLYNQMPGSDLCQMQREYFTSVCPQYGNLIFDSLQQLVQQYRSPGTPGGSDHSNPSHSYMNSYGMHGSPTTMLAQAVSSSVHHLSGNGSNSSSHSHSPDDSHSTMTLNGQNQTAAMITGSEGHHQQQGHHHHPHHHQHHQSMDFFPSMSSLDALPSSALLFDAQSAHLNYSPSYTSVSDSDRESTSSNLSGVNEKRMHINSSYYTQRCSLNPDVAESVVVATAAAASTRPATAALAAAVVATKGNGSHSSVPVSASKRNGRRGRPPKKESKSRSKGNGKLWEFIRDLLLNPVTNPSLIRWERREDGVFKFIQSDKVAKMWGERKQNPRMTYEKLSRAMRYYYKSQVLLPVFGRRLVYKFGPNATGWRPQYDMPKPPGYSG